jgi:hypothetical protein
LKFHLSLFFISAAISMAQNFEQAGGPAILSRGGGAGAIGSEPTALTFTVGVNAVYDSNLVATPTAGQPVNAQQGSYGVESRATLFGVHRFKRSSLGISYTGNYLRFNSDLYSGTTQTLQLSYDQQLSKKLALRYFLSAGTSNLPYGAGVAGGQLVNANLIDPNLTAVPTQEIFNIRTNFIQGGAGFLYQVNHRLSFQLMATGSGVRRDLKELGGLNGYSGSADVSYRASKRSTFSVTYSFSHYEFPGAFGASDIMSFGGGYQRAVGRDWQLGFTGSVTRVESLGLTRIALDPIVASLLGETSGVEAFYAKNYLPGLNANITRRMRKGTLTFSAARFISPGNGLFLTSQNNAYNAAYSYTGLRNWSLYASAGYSQLSSLTRTAGQYTGVTVGLGASHAIYRTLHFTANLAYRDQFISSSTFKHNGERVSAGLAWSPRPLPLVIW